MTRNTLELLIVAGGILHFGTLLASALVPRVLDWRASLEKLDPLLRELVWVHGAFIVIVIFCFGVLSVAFAEPLAAGNPLARGMCAFIALFWAARLVVQMTVFNAKAYLTTPLLKIGYHSLTIVFLYHTVVYGIAGLWTP